MCLSTDSVQYFNRLICAGLHVILEFIRSLICAESLLEFPVIFTVDTPCSEMEVNVEHTFNENWISTGKSIIKMERECRTAIWACCLTICIGR